MSDGANIGVTADRALRTILGGADEPEEVEQLTPAQVRERVMACPSPLEDKGAFDYGIATDTIAKAFLLVEEAEPGTLLAESYYGPENTDIEGLWGIKKDGMAVVWDRTTALWPGFDQWLGGASGFMVGFAYNTACYVLDMPGEPNPAIVEID